jgi:GDP-mannose 6-dehydrogenase
VPPGTIEDLVEPALAESLKDAPVTVGVGMCPEFLREGTALVDFYSSPLTVVGSGDPRVAEVVQRLFDFLDEPVRAVPVRVAEALKYACNAFHATKVSFANEMGRLFRLLGVDAREVMDLFCDDTKLNISSQYLSPGFAFGGSCLPKDMRSLLYLARMNFLDLPLLSGTMATNALSVADVVNRVVGSDAHAIALLGLSFKMHSDDLRESPYVELAETLIGKGFDVRIYDPIVNPANLVGANRQFVNSKLPHLQRVLSSDPLVTLRGADLALVSSCHPAVVGALSLQPPKTIIDLSGRLGDEVEALPGYQGVAW